MEKDIWDVVIIGGGAAGLSAASTLGRARRRVLVVDAGEPRNRFAAHMHVVLGHDGADPAKLLATGRDEASGYGVEFTSGIVERIDETESGVALVAADGTTIQGRIAIVATGLRDELPDIPGLAERWGSTVLHCPYCHGWEVRDQRFGVLASSPLAVHQAELVRQWSDRVVLFSEAMGPVDPATEHRLRSRGVEIVPSRVVEVVGDAPRISGVRTDDGETVAIDAIFVAPALTPHDGFLAHLGLERADGPQGSFLAVDPTGKTSNDRIWAVGNVSNPAASVAMAISAGVVAGGTVNMALITAEFDAAERRWHQAPADADPVQYWEARYGDAGRVWSGRPNQALVDVVGSLPAGCALDLGCGEGGDALWLATQGWQVTGVDISPTAVARAQAAATSADLPAERLRWLVHDLASWTSQDSYDLVTACFLQSPVEFPRTDVLRRAAGAVAPNGHLLIVSHAEPPPWANLPEHHDHLFPSPDEELRSLDLPDGDWEVLIAETRSRDATSPDGKPGVLIDGVVLLRRPGKS